MGLANENEWRNDIQHEYTNKATKTQISQIIQSHNTQDTTLSVFHSL